MTAEPGAGPGAPGRRGPDDLAALGVRLRAGDESALAGCQAALGPALRRFLRRLLPDEAVDDALQAVLMELWRCRERVDPDRLDAWTRTVARRRAVDLLRARPPACLPLAEWTGGRAASRDDVADRIAGEQDVRLALAALPLVQREAIALAYYGGFSQREIAARLGAPVGTVKARTARGLRRLGLLLDAPPARRPRS
ncbi:RNA polymerase sigma factor [Actinomadura gamaensis]|uniref:RNA polymerase sigma factor n=1 Tax=Actinomadura gamaensis TaxID=1763541 RepID=A0ABV9TSH6_9ACTN